MRRSGTTTRRTDTARRPAPGGDEPGGAERRLKAQVHCRPFGGAPQSGEDRRQRKRHLAPEDLRSGHRPLAGEIERDRNRRSTKSRAIREFRQAEPSVGKQRNTYRVSFRREGERVCVATAGNECCWSLYASCMFATDKTRRVQSKKRGRTFMRSREQWWTESSRDNLHWPFGQALARCCLGLHWPLKTPANVSNLVSPSERNGSTRIGSDFLLHCVTRSPCGVTIRGCTRRMLSSWRGWRQPWLGPRIIFTIWVADTF